MNARTFSEKAATWRSRLPAVPVRRQRRRPIVENRAPTSRPTSDAAGHQADRRHLGLFPAEDGIFDIPFRQDLFTAKVTASRGRRTTSSVRYARDRNSQPSGAGLRAAPSSWATTHQHLRLGERQPQLGRRGLTLNELVFQYADFVNEVPATDTGPSYSFRTGSRRAKSALRTTEQRNGKIP